LATAALLALVSDSNAGCCKIKIGGTGGKIIGSVAHSTTPVVRGAVVGSSTVGGAAVGAWAGGPAGGVAGAAAGGVVGDEVNKCFGGHC
jgi:hypothetical protein